MACVWQSSYLLIMTDLSLIRKNDTGIFACQSHSQKTVSNNCHFRMVDFGNELQNWSSKYYVKSIIDFFSYTGSMAMYVNCVKA